MNHDVRTYPDDAAVAGELQRKRWYLQRNPSLAVQNYTPPSASISPGNSASAKRVLDSLAGARERSQGRHAYHQAYYALTRARRLRLKSHRNQIRRWCTWLLTELRERWPPEPALPIPERRYPIRRPLLRLRRVC